MKLGDDREGKEENGRKGSGLNGGRQNIYIYVRLPTSSHGRLARLDFVCMHNDEVRYNYIGSTSCRENTLIRTL